MIITPLMWRSLDRFSILFHFMPTNPIEYDAKNRKFEFNRVSLKMWPYLCSIVIVFLSTFAPCMVLAIFRLFGLLYIPLGHVMLLLLVTLMSVMLLLAELITATLGYKLVGLINCVIEMDKRRKKCGKEVWNVTFVKGLE